MTITPTITFTDEQILQIARAIGADPDFRIAIARQQRKSPDTYTVAEAAKAFRVSTKTIGRRIEAKLIPVVENLSPPRIPAAWVEQQLNPRADSSGTM